MRRAPGGRGAARPPGPTRAAAGTLAADRVPVCRIGRPAGPPGSRSYDLAATAMMSAFVLVVTTVLQAPDPAVIFVALAFGPRVGLLAGALGTVLADLVLGLAAYTPLDALAYGGEGLLAGAVALRGPTWLLPGWLAGFGWAVV